jgi:DNA helicase-2/ATP-dependent DNA helicase PcrA
VAKLHLLARAEGIPLTHAAARILDSDELTPQARRALGSLVGDIARWRDMAQSLPHAELARQITGGIGLYRDAGRTNGRRNRPGGLKT